MEYTIFKLKNLSPLHIGTGKENYDFSASDLQSDTISAALAAMRVAKGKDKEVDKFLSSFAISSAFPFVGDRFYLPKPQGRIDVSVNGQEEHLYRKRLKKIQFIDSSIWNKLMQGESIAVDDNQINNIFLDEKNINGSNGYLYKSQVNERVTVSRIDGQDAEPFFFDWKYFDSKAGLYCLVKASKEVTSELKELFEMLSEFGIGTDKNIGGGKFELEVQTLKLSDIKDANASILLSLYIPTEQEVSQLDLENSKYEITLRGGYMAGSNYDHFKHLRKKSVYMFKTGSLFNTTNSLNGKLVDLRPEWNDKDMHPVFRSGIPFVIPVKININE